VQATSQANPILYKSEVLPSGLVCSGSVDFLHQRSINYFSFVISASGAGEYNSQRSTLFCVLDRLIHFEDFTANGASIHVTLLVGNPFMEAEIGKNCSRMIPFFVFLPRQSIPARGGLPGFRPGFRAPLPLLSLKFSNYQQSGD
jgi:hypothetical protein